MPFDHGGFETPSRTESLALIAGAPIGRVVFTERALPAVQPVTFALDGADVVFRTPQGSKLAAATQEAIVAFEADEFDPITRSGWAVTIIGRARHVVDPAEVAAAEALPLDAWSPDPDDLFVRIESGLVVGKRLPHDRKIVNTG